MAMYRNGKRKQAFREYRKMYDLCDYDDIMFKKGVSQVNKLSFKFNDVSSSLLGKMNVKWRQSDA